jgi:hypothetical protein
MISSADPSFFDDRFEADAFPEQISDEAADIIADLLLEIVENQSSETPQSP